MTVEDDAVAVRNAAMELMDNGHPIIVLAHSYGGIVVAEAIGEDLFAKLPSGPGVVHLIHLSAWLILPRFSVNDMFEKYAQQTERGPADRGRWDCADQECCRQLL